MALSISGKSVLGIVLAGAAGKRLAPLTADRAKSAVPFGGLYRLVDFALSNLVNAGIRKICVLTQYKSHSLDRHITTTWRLNSLLDNYVTPVPAQQRLGPHWYTGSADAIYQSLNLIHDERPDLVVVFGADHVYRMDPAQMIEASTWPGAPGSPWRRSRCPGRRPRRSAWSRPAPTGTDRGVPGEARRPARPCPAARMRLRVHGQLRVRHRGAGRGAAGRRRRRGQPAQHRRRHHPDAGAATARRTSTTSCRTRCPAPPGGTTATGARSGRSTPTSTAHMDLCAVGPGVQPVQRPAGRS